MIIDYPTHYHIPFLRQLWKEAFGDPDGFINSFFRTAFSPQRCRCVLDGDVPAAALYWFPCTVGEEKIAYLYAVATAKAYRAQGLCHALMADTHALLAAQGYAGAILVPGNESLFRFYETMGYRTTARLRTLHAKRADTSLPLQAIGETEYAALRKKMLPPDSVIQEGENLLFLREQVRFFRGDDWLLAAWEDNGILHGMELLGNTDAAPHILRSLNCREGQFRTPGSDIPFAMYLPFRESPLPRYFAFAFD